VNYDNSLVVTITATCYAWAPSSGDHLFTCGAIYRPPHLQPNMKSSSHKTWQTSFLFLKPLQIQNLKRKKWGNMAYYVPPS